MKNEITVRGQDKKLIEKFLKQISLFRSFKVQNLQCVLEGFKIITVKKKTGTLFFRTI